MKKRAQDHGESLLSRGCDLPRPRCMALRSRPAYPITSRASRPLSPAHTLLCPPVPISSPCSPVAPSLMPTICRCSERDLKEMFAIVLGCSAGALDPLLDRALRGRLARSSPTSRHGVQRAASHCHVVDKVCAAACEHMSSRGCGSRVQGCRGWSGGAVRAVRGNGCAHVMRSGARHDSP